MDNAWSHEELEDRYNWLSRDKESRIKLISIFFILFLLFYFSLIPLIPNTIIHVLNISDKYASTVWLFSMLIFALPLPFLSKKIGNLKMDITDSGFYFLQYIHRNLKGIPDSRMNFTARYKKIFKSQVDLLDDIVEDYETIPSLSAQNQLQMIKKLVLSLREKAIPAINEGKKLKEISEICGLLSMIFLDRDVNKNRNDCQVILDTLPSQKRLRIDKYQKIKQILKSDNPIIQLVTCIAISALIFGFPVTAVLIAMKVSSEILIGAVITVIFLPGTSLFIVQSRK